MKTLTVIAPAYNEAEGIADFYHAVKEVLSQLSGYETSMLFVVDGGTDHTFDVLKEIAEKDSTVSVLKLSRNFGPQMAILAGIDYVDADIVIMMDSDMQHPPTLIPKLIETYERGNDVVYTIREHTEQLGFFARNQSLLFYWIINLISDTPITGNACDFRLMSRKVVNVIRKDFRERTMFLRGLMNWVGFRQEGIRFTAAPRAKGQSKLNFGYRLGLALFGIISFSKKPLRVATFVGVIFAFFALAFTAVTVVQYFTGEITQPGYATIIVLISFFGGIQLIFLGIIGEYIGAIFDEVKGRPRYIVETFLPPGTSGG